MWCVNSKNVIDKKHYINQPFKLHQFQQSLDTYLNSAESHNNKCKIQNCILYSSNNYMRHEDM